MSIELTDVITLAKHIDGDVTGVHYLLGYLWATLSDEQQENVYKSLSNKEGGI
jgi:hypothetical protein